MSGFDKQRAVVALRLVAAQAQKLADDLDAGRLWPGDLSDGLSTINTALRDMPQDGRRL